MIKGKECYFRNYYYLCSCELHINFYNPFIMFGVQQVNHTLENCAQSPWGAIPRGALVEPVKGGYVVRSCALFSFLCELHIPSAFRRRHAARPATGGSRRATSRFVFIFFRRISK